jgi:hypothetical protein
MAEYSNINYRSDPRLFSNKCILNMGMLETVVDLIEGNEPVNAHHLVVLAILAESVVLNESVILEDDVVFDSDVLRDSWGFNTGTVDLVNVLESGGAIEPVGGESAGNTIYSEGSVLGHPGAEPIRVSLIHGSHVVIEWDENKYAATPIDKMPLRNWHKFAREVWENSYFQALAKYGYDRTDRYGEFRLPWKLLADCHGIPYISDAFYTARDVNTKYPTNIGIELYRKLEQLHTTYFKKISRFLGPTYVYIPPILSLILKECKSPEDIPPALVSLRAKHKSFRSKCTSLEIELRQAKKLQDQIEIIRDIETAYEAIATKVATPNRRLLLRLFDVVKEVDPLHMSIETLNQAKEYLLEEDGVLKIPGYYNLWKATTQVEQGLPLLKRIFGTAVRPELLADMNDLVKTVKQD